MYKFLLKITIFKYIEIFIKINKVYFKNIIFLEVLLLYIGVFHRWDGVGRMVRIYIICCVLETSKLIIKRVTFTIARNKNSGFSYTWSYNH
jgi:hypothetical protein